jgi:hypothetical protein
MHVESAPYNRRLFNARSSDEFPLLLSPLANHPPHSAFALILSLGMAAYFGGGVAGRLALPRMRPVRAKRRARHHRREDWAVIGVEVKRETGRLSTDQVTFRLRLEAVGWTYYVVRLIEDVQALAL